MQQKLHTFLDLCKAKTLITPNFPYFIPLRPLSQEDELLAPTARPKPCRETKKIDGSDVPPIFSPIYVTQKAFFFPI